VGGATPAGYASACISGAAVGEYGADILGSALLLTGIPEVVGPIVGVSLDNKTLARDLMGSTDGRFARGRAPPRFGYLRDYVFFGGCTG